MLRASVTSVVDVMEPPRNAQFCTLSRLSVDPPQR
jgi:hypothetical protein